MELFYSPELNENQSVVKLEEEEFHHLSKVLRVRLGDVIYLTNGNGLIAVSYTHLTLPTTERV